MTVKLELFVSYSHKDAALRERLATALKPLEHSGLVEVWFDGAIKAGEEIDKTILEHLCTAHVILLLISPEFLASDYCYKKEMEQALRRHKEGTARVVPIILRHSMWEKSPFSRLKVLPKDGRPVAAWPDQDEAFKDISVGLDLAVSDLREKLQRRGSEAEEKVQASTEGQRQQALLASSDHQLNLKYTFDTFVVGPANQFAHAAAQAVSERPSKAYNPLFIYGGVGLGKTHLLHAIGHEIRRRNKGYRLTYLSMETFTDDMIEAIRSDRMRGFKEQYRNNDVLLIDDIQFIAGKERTQEEFFHIFNALYDVHKQLIFSADRPPREIPTLEERLHSRFEWGLIADIQPPDLETKIAILTHKADRHGIALPRDVALYIAGSIKANVRELEGALIRLVAYSSLHGAEITLGIAQETLSEILKADEGTSRSK